MTKAQTSYSILIVWLALVGGVISYSTLDASKISYYTPELVHKECIIEVISTGGLDDYVALLEYQDKEEVIIIPLTLEELKLLNSSTHPELYKDLILYRSDNKSKEIVSLGQAADSRVLGILLLAGVGIIFMLILGSNTRY
mgnify:CR=1 FL=1